MRTLLSAALMLASVSAFSSDSLSDLSVGTKLALKKDLVINAGEYYVSLGGTCSLTMNTVSPQMRTLAEGSVLTVVDTNRRVFRGYRVFNEIAVDDLAINTISCYGKSDLKDASVNDFVSSQDFFSIVD